MAAWRLIRFILGHPANQGRAGAALASFLRWQVSSRLATGPMVHGWVNGARFLVRRGETGLTGNIYTGLHEFADMAFVLHFLRRDDLFLDVGANVGSYTLLACAARGARGLAFEPVPETFERLVDNLRLNRMEDRVQALNRGVGAEPGTLLFSAGQDTMNHALAHGEAIDGAVPVEMVTLDDATRGLSPDLLKIDVEGFEWPAMQGASKLLSSPSLRAIIMELNGSGQRYGFDEALLLQMLLDRGFRTYTYDPVGRQLQDLAGKNLASGNTLFVRDVDFVAQRLVDSEAFAVFGRRYRQIVFLRPPRNTYASSGTSSQQPLPIVDKSLLVKLIGFPATLIHGDTLVLDRWRWLKQRMPATLNGETLIDIGCGTGSFTIGAALRGYKSLGLSWDERNQHMAANRATLCGAGGARFEIQDARQLDQRTDLHGQFDFVINCENIEHILDDSKLMRDIAACLKPGGRLLLTTPYFHYRPMVDGDKGPFSTVEDGGHVRRGYTKAMLEELCEHAGLRVDEVSFCSGALSQLISGALRKLSLRFHLFAWALTFPLRPLPPLLDWLLTPLLRWPFFSICVEAYKPRYAPVAADAPASAG